MRTAILLLPGVVLGATPLSALTGVVVDPAREPLAGASVEVAGGEGRTQTREDGGFDLPGVQPPCTLRVHHPKYGSRELAVEAGTTEPLEVVLEPVTVHSEVIEVAAGRDDERFVPVGLPDARVAPGDSPTPPATLLDVVAEVPGVAENGQGGIFQVYSIRGVSRQRIATQVSGVPILGERRAGVSASFLDPLLMQRAEVLRGPASAVYGAGALGGVVEVSPRRFKASAVEAGWQSQGHERYLAAGWGDGSWSLGIAHREASDAETPDGTPLYSRFTQTSAVLSRRWSAGDREIELLLAPSVGDDIGKANTRYPDRASNYPSERHLVARVGVVDPDGWSLAVFAHPNDLHSRTVRPGESVDDVYNDAFDFGASLRRELEVRDGVVVQTGFDYLGRRGVTARETETSLVTGERTPEVRTLDHAELDEAGAYATLRWRAGRATLQGGGRLTWQRQENAGSGGFDDTALDGYFGGVAPLPAGFEVSANLATGLRFPSLGERFFTGTTGRGEVEGNADLDPERAFNADLGVRWAGQRLFAGTYLFANRIRDYIERIEVAPDVLSFVNLTSGTIRGVEVEAGYQPAPGWRLSFSGQAMRGRDDEGHPLADVPARRVQLGAGYLRDRWEVDARWQYRDGKDDPGSGEKPIGDAHLVSASLRYRLRPGLGLRVSGNNLLDQTYFNAADDLLPPAPGRSIGFGVSWSPR